MVDDNAARCNCMLERRDGESSRPKRLNGWYQRHQSERAWEATHCALDGIASHDPLPRVARSWSCRRQKRLTESRPRGSTVWECVQPLWQTHPECLQIWVSQCVVRNADHGCGNHLPFGTVDVARVGITLGTTANFRGLRRPVQMATSVLVKPRRPTATTLPPGRGDCRELDWAGDPASDVAVQHILHRLTSRDQWHHEHAGARRIPPVIPDRIALCVQSSSAVCAISNDHAGRA